MAAEVVEAAPFAPDIAHTKRVRTSGVALNVAEATEAISFVMAAEVVEAAPPRHSCFPYKRMKSSGSATSSAINHQE